MRIYRLAYTGVAGIMGLGLIGVGAHAAFTTSTTSKQTVTAGKLTLVLHAPAADVASGTGTSTLTLNPLGPVNSSFTTGTVTISVHNAGTLTARLIKSSPGDTYNAATSADKALADQLYVCEVSTGEVIYNGLLSAAPSQTIAATLAPGATTHYVFNVYAGTETTACGAVTGVGSAAVAGVSHSPSLTNTAEGGVATPKLTLTAES